MLDQFRERIRLLHYSLRTEDAYVHWVRAFDRFHGLRRSAALGTAQVGAFLAWLAGRSGILVPTHKPALFAMPFFFGKVLGCDLPWMKEIRRPCSHRRLPGIKGAVVELRSAPWARSGPTMRPRIAPLLG